jgi:hypothetical protein
MRTIYVGVSLAGRFMGYLPCGARATESSTRFVIEETPRLNPGERLQYGPNDHVRCRMVRLRAPDNGHVVCLRPIAVERMPP